MVVVIGDIIGSRALDEPEREEAQEKLLEVFEQIRDKRSSLKSPHTITLGDEFQAVYSGFSTVIDDCWKILAALHPVSVRFSISVGRIVTPINKSQAIGMDGPAFHEARDGIEELKKTGRLFIVKIRYAEENEKSLHVLNLMNSSLNMLSNEMLSWKKIRYQILVMINDGWPVKEIAKELNISETAVYKNRDDGDLALIIELKNTIHALLTRELKKLSAP